MTSSRKGSTTSATRAGLSTQNWTRWAPSQSTSRKRAKSTIPENGRAKWTRPESGRQCTSPCMTRTMRSWPSPVSSSPPLFSTGPAKGKKGSPACPRRSNPSRSQSIDNIILYVSDKNCFFLPRDQVELFECSSQRGSRLFRVAFPMRFPTSLHLRPRISLHIWPRTCLHIWPPTSLPFICINMLSFMSTHSRQLYFDVFWIGRWPGLGTLLPLS